MTRANHSPLFVTKELLETRYAGAEVIFLAGSVVRGEATAYSDVDLVVVYPKLPQAFRESFYHKEWPVEAFVHDPETLNYFFHEFDRPSGEATLPEMVVESLEVPGPSAFSQKLKTMAAEVIRLGPPILTRDAIDDRRYHISELVEDIREPSSRQELIAGATLAYNALADFYFRSRGQWSSDGKYLLKRLKKTDPVFFRRFSEAFDILFATGHPDKVIELAEELLAPQGGLLFDGYRRQAPSEWRR